MKVKRRKLQKALNHTNKQTKRLKQLGLTHLVCYSHDVRLSLLTIAEEHGIKINPNGMPQ